MRIPVLLSLFVAAAWQYGAAPMSNRNPREWQTARFEVRRVAIAPGERVASPDREDAVLIFLTAGLDGRMPPVEAIWWARGSAPLENRANMRFEAIAIGLPDAPRAGPDLMPPEAQPMVDPADARILIDNPRVLVVKTRYRINAYADPPHFHPLDILSVYLSGGSMWSSNAMWGPNKVSRGDVELVPANTLHAFGNAGSDPVDLIAIVPK